jgi:hypothetical protein
MSVTPPTIHTRTPPGRRLSESITGSSRADACGSMSTGTTRRRPFEKTISTPLTGPTRGAARRLTSEASQRTRGVNSGVRNAPRSPFRSCRCQLVNKDRELPWQRAVALP